MTIVVFVIPKLAACPNFYRGGISKSHLLTTPSEALEEKKIKKFGLVRKANIFVGLLR